MCMHYTSLGSMWASVIKIKPLLVRFDNVNSDLKFPQQLAARGNKNSTTMGTEKKNEKENHVPAQLCP